MTTVRIKSEDLIKAVELMKKSKNAFSVSVETLFHDVRLTFEGDDGKMVTVTLYAEASKAFPTVNKTERL